MALSGAPERIRPLNRQLWQKFVHIAQPYFYPMVRGGGWMTLLLIVMLLVLVFVLLLLGVAAMTLVGHHLNPTLTEAVAPGLYPMLHSLLSSPSVLLVLASLLIPLGCFLAVGRSIRLRWQQWALLATVLFLSIAVTGINVGFSYIGNFFTNALVQKNQALAYLFVGVYGAGFLLGIPIVALYHYVQSYLGLHWRDWLTRDFLGRYFQGRTYYDIETTGEIDNPDQRLSEDIRNFTRVTLSFLLIILGSLMDLVSFSGILWSKSQLLVGVVLVYSAVGTLLTLWMGRRLVRLNYDQLRYEADFRYALVHVRDNAESVAFYRGEAQEVQRIRSRFLHVLRNYNLLIGWQRNLSFLTTAYRYLPVVLPYLVLFPQYFSGTIQFGDMTQANFAFAQVYGALSLIVSQIEQITTFAAGVDRLAAFTDTMVSDAAPSERIQSEEAPQLALENVTLLTPNAQRTLVEHLSVHLPPQACLLMVGPSGVGKSSLLRAIAGLWQQGTGTIRRPALDAMLFLPQRPYMILGSLRAQLLYPRQHQPISEAALRRVLDQVRLAELPERVGGFDVELDWADVLSLGEQQRVAFARLLLTQPQYAVLDEATSALDVKNEEHLYHLLQAAELTYVSVGHRPSLVQYHQYVLELAGEGHWRLLPVETYLLETSPTAP
jgi:vitamin B12/bleomycin/antimicrobial peptide transport system ATP-binding/permease protein